MNVGCSVSDFGDSLIRQAEHSNSLVWHSLGRNHVPHIVFIAELETLSLSLSFVA